MKTYKTETGRCLYFAIIRRFGECVFTAEELENAIDLAIRRCQTLKQKLAIDSKLEHYNKPII